MRIAQSRRSWGLIAAVIVAAGLCRTAAAGEEAKLKAFVAWQGQGRTFQTGAKQATFVGSLAGPLFVDTANGIVTAGRLTCPAIIEIGLDDATQRGHARCAITEKGGAQIFAEIDCTGVYMVGCDGDLKLTGGTERFAGISGGGKVTIRSDFRQISAAGDDSLRQDASGSLNIPELHYQIP